MIPESEIDETIKDFKAIAKYDPIEDPITKYIANVVIPTLEQLRNKAIPVIPLVCKDCHKTPQQKPDETFHWEVGRLETCICSTCLNKWFVGIAAYYRFNQIMNGEDLFQK